MSPADRRRVDAIRDLLNFAKSKACVDCGIRYHPCQVDLDHRTGTEKEPSRRQSFSSWAKSVSLARLEAEIKKCDPRCANCHRLKTYREQQEARA